MIEEMTIYQKLFKVKAAGIKLQRDTAAFNYKYATLSQIQEKLSGVLQEQRLLVMHSIINNKVVTQIFDIDGSDEVASEITLTEGIKPQDKGSEITYYRRYNLLSLLDLEVEDDDGAKASNPVSNTDDLAWIGESNITNIKALIDGGTTMTLKDVRAKYKVSKANAEKLSLLGIV